MPLNEAPLYSEESVFPKAKDRALTYLAELIPWEFGKYAAEDVGTFGQEIVERVERFKQAQKISNSSS